MKSLQHILTDCPHQIPNCHLKRAFLLHQKLMSGITFTYLGGQRIKQSPSIVRFKVGRNWRLLYREVEQELQPYCLITRQKFDRAIRRR